MCLTFDTDDVTMTNATTDRLLWRPNMTEWCHYISLSGGHLSFLDVYDCIFTNRRWYSLIVLLMFDVWPLDLKQNVMVCVVFVSDPTWIKTWYCQTDRWRHLWRHIRYHRLFSLLNSALIRAILFFQPFQQDFKALNQFKHLDMGHIRLMLFVSTDIEILPSVSHGIADLSVNLIPYRQKQIWITDDIALQHTLHSQGR